MCLLSSLLRLGLAFKHHGYFCERTHFRLYSAVPSGIDCVTSESCNKGTILQRNYMKMINGHFSIISLQNSMVK